MFNDDIDVMPMNCCTLQLGTCVLFRRISAASRIASCSKIAGDEGSMVDLEEVIGWAYEAVRSGEAEGAHLDFSRESVGRLEELLQHVHESRNWDDVDDMDAWSMACRYGAYLGETMLRNDFGRLGFAWGEDSDGEPCLKPTAEATGSGATVSRIVPIFKCFKRLRSGSSESVIRFYASCLSVVNGQRQAEILERLEKPTDEKPDEQADVWEGQPVVEPGSQDGSWTFGMHQLMKGRRFSFELPDQYTLIPDSDGRQLARYTQGIEDESECPEIIYSAMEGDLPGETKEALSNDIIPEARVQLMRKALYGSEAANGASRVLEDWVVEGRNCQVIVFEVRQPSTLETASENYEYVVLPVAYDHEDFLRLTDAWGHFGEGQLKKIALSLAGTIELDALVNLRRLHELETFCEGAADADAFCECIAAVANMLNLSNNERMNANLWRAVRASNNTSAALLANYGMQRIQAEAYNAGLNEAVTYYGLFVRALENQAELGTEGLGRMIDVVERYADVFIVDHVTIDGDEEGTKAVNELGIISIPLAYETLRGRLAAVKDANEASPHLSLSSLTEAIAECADSHGYCDYQCILDKTGDTSTPEEVNALLEQCWRDGLLRMRMTGSETRYALRWSDDEWHEVCDEENARFDAEQEAREKQNQLEHHRRMEQEIAARKTSLDAIKKSVEDTEESMSSLEKTIAESRGNLGQLQEAALEAYDVAKSISDEANGLGLFAFGRKRELREKLAVAQDYAEQKRKAVQDAKDEISRLESEKERLRSDLLQQERALRDADVEITDLEHLLSENPEPLAVDLQERVIDMMMIWASPITPAWCVENVAGIESELTAMGILKDLIRSSHLMEIDKGVYALAPTAQS